MADQLEQGHAERVAEQPVRKADVDNAAGRAVQLARPTAKAGSRGFTGRPRSVSGPPAVSGCSRVEQ
jgi:hypothetical protein